MGIRYIKGSINFWKAKVASKYSVNAKDIKVGWVKRQNYPDGIYSVINIVSPYGGKYHVLTKRQIGL